MNPHICYTHVYMIDIYIYVYINPHIYCIYIYIHVYILHSFSGELPIHPTNRQDDGQLDSADGFSSAGSELQRLGWQIWRSAHSVFHVFPIMGNYGDSPNMGLTKDFFMVMFFSEVSQIVSTKKGIVWFVFRLWKALKEFCFFPVCLHLSLQITGCGSWFWFHFEPLGFWRIFGHKSPKKMGPIWP